MQNKTISKLKKVAIFLISSFFMISNISGAAVNQNVNPNLLPNIPLDERIYDEINPSEVNIRIIARVLEAHGGSPCSREIESMARRIDDAKEKFAETGAPSKINFDLPEVDGGDWYFTLDEANNPEIKWKVQEWIPILQNILFLNEPFVGGDLGNLQLSSELKEEVRRFAQICGYTDNMPDYNLFYLKNNYIIYAAIMRFFQELVITQVDFIDGVPIKILSSQLNNMLLYSLRFHNYDSFDGYFYFDSERPKRRDIKFQFAMNFIKLLKLLSMRDEERLSDLAIDLNIPQNLSTLQFLYESKNDAKYRPRDIREYSPFVFSIAMVFEVFLTLPEDAHQLLIETFVAFCDESGIKLTKAMNTILNVNMKWQTKYREIDKFLFSADKSLKFDILLEIIFKGYLFMKDWNLLHQQMLQNDIKAESLREIMNKKSRSFRDFLINVMSREEKINKMAREENALYINLLMKYMKSRIDFDDFLHRLSPVDDNLGLIRFKSSLKKDPHEKLFIRSSDGSLKLNLKYAPDELEEATEATIKTLVSFPKLKENQHNLHLKSKIAEFLVDEQNYKFRKSLGGILRRE